MALYQQADDGLVPVRRVKAGADLYEQEIEELAWRNLDEVTGEELFPVRRQARVSGGIVDIVALTRQGEVAVIEVKRSVDRSQLAQCLEYAGWARTTSLDELAGMYHAGTASFWEDWQDFTSTSEPVRVQRNPLVVLIAQDFDARTRSALEYLTEHSVPVKVVGVTVYQSSDGSRFVDVEGVAEPIAPEDGGSGGSQRRESLRISMQDLIDAGLLDVGATLIWSRPRAGAEYQASVTLDAKIKLADGREFRTPSGAAMAAAQVPSYDGWYAWRVGTTTGPRLNELRLALASQEATASNASAT